jgi:hypothetical protein
MPTRAVDFRPPFAAVLAALLGACQAAPGAMNEEEFCVEYARRECAKVALACGFERPTTCEEVRKTACRAWVQRTKSEVRGFRPENVEACLKKVSDTYGEPLIKAEHWKALADVCQRVFQGSRRALEPCAADGECAAGLVCDKRRCAPRRDVGPGAPCANPGDTCPRTEYCKQADEIVWMCTRKLEKGRPCGVAEPCAEALRCRGTCTDRLPVSAPCAQDDDCETGYCFPYRGVCAAGLNFALGSPSCDAYEGKAGPAPDAGAGGSAPPAADAGAARDL